MKDYSKYQVPRYQTVYVCSLYLKNKGEFFGSLELVLEYMRNKIKEEFEEYSSENMIFFRSPQNGHYIGAIGTKIVPHS